MRGGTRTGARDLIWRWGPAVAWAALIFALSAQPGLNMSPDPSVDGPARHLAHGFFFGVLALLVLHGLGALGGRIDARAALITAALILAYAISDEVHQAFVPDRTANPVDIAYDMIGVLVGIGAAWAWGRRGGS